MIVLGAIGVENVYSIGEFSPSGISCFKVINQEKDEWDLCSETEQDKKEWIETLIKILTKDENSDYLNEKPPVVVKKKEKLQEVIILPMPSPYCNEEWNYNGNGETWECKCSEGFEQSPIDLPKSDNCYSVRHLQKTTFRGVSLASENNLNTSATFNFFKVKGNHLSLVYEDNIVKIKSSLELGEIFDLDGYDYSCKELHFHTPGEHTVNGDTFPMEIQLFCQPTTIGSYSNKAILSWLVEQYPGASNNFLNKIDLLNLPNAILTKKNMKDIDNYYDLSDMWDKFNGYFSYFYYGGSMTNPPCEEHVRWFVVEEPIQLAMTYIEMFKDAMTTIPHVVDQNGSPALLAPEFMYPKNPDGTNRKIQKKHGRQVYRFDIYMTTCNYPLPEEEEEDEIIGHYEKVPTEAKTYAFVPGINPSEIPGSYIIDEKVAKGVYTEEEFNKLNPSSTSESSKKTISTTTRSSQSTTTTNNNRLKEKNAFPLKKPIIKYKNKLFYL